MVPSDYLTNRNFCQWHVIRPRQIHFRHVFTSLEADDIILRNNAKPHNPLTSRVLIDAEGNSLSKYKFTYQYDLYGK